MLTTLDQLLPRRWHLSLFSEAKNNLKMRNFFTLFITCCLLSAVAGEAVNSFLLQPLGLIGTVYVTEQIEQAQNEVNATVEAFKPVNATCNSLVTATLKTCAECIGKKCKDRAKEIQRSCANDLEKFILDVMDFGQNVGNFFQNTLPNFIVDGVGGHLIDAGQEIGNFFTGTLVQGLTDLGGNIGDGIVDLGVNIGSFFENVGQNILNGLETGANFITGTTIDIGNALGDFFGNLGGDVLNFFQGLGKKRSVMRRSLYARQYARAMALRQGAPSCNDFKDETTAKQACLTYYAPQCNACLFDKEKDCPGFKTAYDNIINAANNAAWLQLIKELKYGVDSASYNPADFDPATVGYKNVQATVNVLGRTTTFIIPETVNIFDAQKAGKIIAKYALAWFKQQS